MVEEKSPQKVDSTDSEQAPVSSPASDLLRVHSGHGLSLVEANVLASRQPLRMVLLAGPPEAGKTTLMAGLYEAFRAGPFGGLLFAGSESLIGLEERCHLSRVASGLYKPDTYRTPVEDPTSLVHVGVRRTNLDGPSIDLLFADLSGEHFTNLRDTGVAGDATPLFKAASDVVFLLNGGRLITRKRFACLEDLKTLMRVCHEQGLTNRSVRVQLAATKWDLVLGADAKRKAWIKEILREISDVAQNLYPGASTHKTAMREGNGVNRGHGLEGLLGIWTSDRPLRRYEVSLQRPPQATRQSHRFGLGD